MAALCLVLAPLFLLGAFLGGDALVLHEHGAEGRHYHVVSGSARAEPAHHHGPAQEQRASRAAAQPVSGAAESKECALARERAGALRLELAFPGEVQAPVSDSAPRERVPAVAVAGSAPAAVRHALDPAPMGAGPPGRRVPSSGKKQRSGIALVVTASHAIRI